MNRLAENDLEKDLVLTISFAQLCFAAWRFSSEGNYIQANFKKALLETADSTASFPCLVTSSERESSSAPVGYCL